MLLGLSFLILQAEKLGLLEAYPKWNLRLRTKQGYFHYTV